MQQEQVPAKIPPREQAAAIAFAVAFIGIARVKEISGLSRSTIWRRINGDPSKGIPGGRFPSPTIADGRITRWDLAEVMQWREEQFRLRDERLKKARAAAASSSAATA